MDIQKIKALIPPYYFAQLDEVIADFGINTPLRLAHFMAQCHWESGGFKVMEENLKYSAKRLLEVFPKYFTADSAKKAEFNPQMIANIVYANRMGNGNEASGDGYKYRGRGVIQLTGKDNYKGLDAFIKDADIVDNPDLVSKQYAMLSAGYFWDKNKINAIADKNDIVAVRKKVNGGTHGLENVRELFDKYYSLLK